jgi:hypothetical protein
VDDAGPLRAEARALSEARFVARHRGLWLLKRPVIDSMIDPSPGSVPTFDTQRLSSSTVRMMQESLQMRAELLGEWAHRWMIIGVQKRTDTFPDRISIGRTTHCDVVIKLPFVSKLHAHLFVADDGTAEIVDRSSNGTRLDGRVVAKDVRVAVRPGARLGFGPLEVELQDGAGLYRTFRDRG